MARHALDERIELAESLRLADPHEPTLCGDWNAAQLAGHLVLRERSVMEVLGRVPSHRLNAIAQRAIDVHVAGRSYQRLVDDVADGPPMYSPFALPPVREGVNLLEYFVHHEDLRRAAEGWIPRVLPVQRQAAIWSRLRVAGHLTLRMVPMPVRLEWPGHGAISVGTDDPAVTVTGPPEELALVAFGRQRVARVDYDGDADAVATVREAAISL